MFGGDFRRSEHGRVGFGIGFGEGTVGERDEPSEGFPEFPDDLPFGGDLE
jgi:hypothetical protein